MWKQHDSVCYLLQEKLSSKIAAFDLDHTLIAPKGKRKFPKDAADWKILFNSVQKLRELHLSGFSIVIFSNQALKNIDQKIEELKQKIKSLIEAFEVPFSVFFACSKDLYRKPNKKMFDLFLNLTGINPDQESFFVGDAAGRESDFACSDRKFAINCKLQFKTPEAFFLNEPEREFELEFDPARFLDTEREENFVPMSEQQELVIFVGAPASGKTTLFKTIFQPEGYAWINRDTLKTKAKCLKAVRAALAEGKSCVIDNTNPDEQIRSEFIALAEEHGCSYRIILFDLPPDLVRHLNAYREKLTGKRIPEIAFRVFYKKFELPEDYEQISFYPCFESEAQKALFLELT